MLVAAIGCSQPRPGEPCHAGGPDPLPVEWHRPWPEPCISLGEAGRFDSHHLFAPAVFPLGSGLRMLYCGSGPQANRLFRIGIADSQDGMSWTKHAEPVLEFGDGRTSLVTPTLLRGANSALVREDGKLRMWVAAVDFNTRDMIHRLYETTSPDDGITWSPLAGPLMENVYAPSVLRLNGKYHMWYVDVGSEPWCFRYAISDDGSRWSTGHEEPVLTIEQPWEKDSLFYPFVLFDGRRFLMWYGSYWSARPDTTALGLAVSDDGIHWRKYHSNPVLTPDVNRAFESNYCTSHCVLPLGKWSQAGDRASSRPRGYQIWYATRNRAVRQHKYFSIATAVCWDLKE